MNRNCLHMVAALVMSAVAGTTAARGATPGASATGTYEACKAYVETNVRAGASAEVRSALEKKARADDAIRDFRQEKGRLRNDNTTWYGGSAADKAALVVGQVAKATETATNLILNLIALSPDKKEAQVAKILKDTKDYVVIAVRNWNNTDALMRELAKKRAQDRLPPSAGAAADWAKDTYEMAKMGKEYQEARSEMQKQMDRLDTWIRKWQQISEKSLAALQDVEKAAEKEVARTCKGLPSESEPSDTPAAPPLADSGSSPAPGTPADFGGFNSANNRMACAQGRAMINRAMAQFNQVDTKYRQPVQPQINAALAQFDKACANQSGGGAAAGGYDPSHAAPAFASPSPDNMYGTVAVPVAPPRYDSFADSAGTGGVTSLAPAN